MAPLFNQKCVHCHQAGGIAPFVLDDYATARQRSNQIAAITAARIMPPYLLEAGGDCGSFDESRALSDAQIELIQRWSAAGAPEGQPVRLELPELPTLQDAREWITPLFTPQIEGGALAQFDEYRCLPIELGLTEDTWVTGWEVLPGNPAMVHHLIGFLVNPEAEARGGSNASVMQALDDASPDRVGWPCFGAAGEGVEVESVPIVWAPGAGAVSYPGGVGIRLREGRQLVVQVHYNLADASLRGQTDQTSVKLRLADTVQRQGAIYLEDRFLDTLDDAQPATLPPGQASVSYSWQATIRSALQGLELPFALELLAISPHMHTRGQSWTFELGSGGNFDCQARVPRWDFNWQSMYTYTAPPQLLADSEMRLTCEYDTRAETEPVLPGWGTRNEMCLATLLVALPPGIFF
ncbi:MAG: hypothetical protein RL685_3130 [Pseudomonadota bacterium]